MSLTLKQSLMHAYFRDLDARNTSSAENTLIFDYIPEEISDSKTANYNYVDIPGRSEPIIGYTNSSLREFSIHLMFMAGIGQRSHPSGQVDDAFAVKQKVDWLRSLTYPDYSGQYVRPPHKVLFSIGQLIKSVCIIPSVNVVYKGPWSTIYFLI